MTRTLKPLAALTLAGVALFATTTSALALDATATSWLNVRPTPSTAFDPVDTLYPGEAVTIEECNAANWCRISHPGDDGWVNADYLDPVTDPGGSPAAPNCHFVLKLVPPPPKLEIVCDTGSGGGGGGGGGGAPPPSPGTDEVCFYDQANYTGPHVCYGIGTYNVLPPAQNDKLTSVELRGAAHVRLCQGPNMGPFCRDLTASETQLGPYLNNDVSSFRIFTGTLTPLKQACFFDHTNYGGDYFCTGVITLNHMPGGWDDRVSSLAVFGGASVKMCVPMNLAPPFCNTFSANVPTLGTMLNDKASSLKVQ